MGSSRVVGLSPRVVEEMKKLPINIDGRIINCPSVDNFFHFYSQLQDDWSYKIISYYAPYFCN
jgi:hypothetical protein